MWRKYYPGSSAADPLNLQSRSTHAVGSGERYRSEAREASHARERRGRDLVRVNDRQKEKGEKERKKEKREKEEEGKGRVNSEQPRPKELGASSLSRREGVAAQY